VRRATGVQDTTLPSSLATVAMVQALQQQSVRDFIFTQAMVATQWTVTHNLGFDPAGVLVLDASGDTVEGAGVIYDTPGVALRVVFDIPLAGSVYLS
jgi:hypothetical protein